VLALVFAALVWVSFERWGHARSDLGGSLDRAARVAAGEVLYRDVQSPYGPLPDYTVATAFRLFGTHLAVAWTIGLLLVAAESALLLTIARRFCSPAQCFVGVVGFWVLFAFAPGLFGWVLPNTFASTFGATSATLALALAILARERDAPRLFAAASLAAAAAGLSKPDYGFAAALTVLVAACLAPARRGRASLLLAALMPGLLVGLAALGLLAWQVSWDVLVFDNLYRIRSFAQTIPALRAGVPKWSGVLATNVPRYAVEMPLRAAIVAWGIVQAREGGTRTVIGLALAAAALALPLLPTYPDQLDFTLFAPSIGFAWTPAAWVVVAVLAARGAWRGDRAATALLLAAIWSIAQALRWDLRLVWPSYYGVLAPFLVVLIVGRLAAPLVRGPTALAAACVAAVPIVLLAASTAEHYRTYRYTVSYPRGTLRMPAMEGQPLAQVVDTIRASTRPDDWVAVFPEERLINFLSERRHPTRDSGTGPGWLATRDDERACIAELEARRPALVVLTDRRWPEFGAGDLGSYNPRLRAWIAEEYDRPFTTAPNVVRYTVLGPHRCELP
jgi:hypothetical protein